ncbi:MAG: hypothetical protein K2Q12_02435 [Rickettsiales bacterium]|nr:hypothetical protein [Rickettsiales bacterium]
MSAPVVYRYPWEDGFPDVVVHTDLQTRNAHPDYAAAKAGDDEAAVRLVEDLTSKSAVQQLRERMAGSDVLFASVAAIEVEGYNAIPKVFAEHLSRLLDAKVDDGEIRQINKVAQRGQRAGIRW